MKQSLAQLVRFVGPNLLVHPVLTFCISVIIARSLGPEGRGAYGVLVTMIAILPPLVAGGLNWSVQFWAARGQVDRLSLLKTATTLALIAGAFIASCALAGWWTRFPEWLVPPGLGPVGAAGFALALFLAVPRIFWANYFAGQERYGYETWGTTAGTALQLIVLAAAWQLSEVSLDAATLALTLQLGFALALFLYIAGRDLVPAIGAPMLGLTELKEMLRYGRWQYLSTVLSYTNTGVTVLLLAALGSFREAGLYTAVLGPANLLLIPSAPLSIVLLARTTRKAGDPDFSKAVASALRLTLAASLIPAGLAAAVAPTVLPLFFGDRFRDAVAPFWILLPGTIALGLINVVTHFLAGAKRPEWNTAIAAVCGVLTVALNIALIPSHGAIGAALGFSVAHVAAAVVASSAFLRVSGLRVPDLVSFRASDWAPIGEVLRVASRRSR